MVVLIDGYNLLHAARVSRRGSPDLGRFLLCRMLGDWSAVTGHRVVVVFDGSGPPEPLGRQLNDPRVEVIQSGRDRIADDEMDEFLRRYSGARDSLVVSSDRAIQRSAKRRQAGCIRSEDFFERAATEIARAAQASKRTDEKPRDTQGDEVGEWLRHFGYDPDDPPPFEHP